MGEIKRIAREVGKDLGLAFKQASKFAKKRVVREPNVDFAIVPVPFRSRKPLFRRRR